MADDKLAKGKSGKEQIEELAMNIEKARKVAMTRPPGDGMHANIQREEQRLAEMRRQEALRDRQPGQDDEA